MEIDFGRLQAGDRYKIMTASIVPRPVAWVTTLSRHGVRNAAPFSFFNAMSKEPPLLALGVQAKSDGSIKDTAQNILDTGEFVVNLVPVAAAGAMSATSIEAPADVDELDLSNIAVSPSRSVAPPRIALSPIAFECRVHTNIEASPNHFVVLGEVLHAHIDDAFVLDAERLHLDTPKLDLIARMHGRGWYATARDLFEIERPAPFAERAVAPR